MSSKLKRKFNKPPAPLNLTNYSMNQIAQHTGASVNSLLVWTTAREKEIAAACEAEFNDKLHRAEDHAAFVNLLISMYAIKMTWGYTKAQERFLGNLNAAQSYIQRVGIRKAYDDLMKDCGSVLEFDDFDIDEEIELLDGGKGGGS